MAEPKTKKGQKNKDWTGDGRTGNMMTAEGSRFNRDVKRGKRAMKNFM